MDDILPMRGESVDIDSSIHILNNLGKHKIHIHNQEKHLAHGLLRINANISEFGYLKMDDILSINDNLTLKISCIDCGGATNWHLSIDEMIAQEYGIAPHSTATIRHINPLSLELSQTEVTFKNQYISRGTLWKIERDLVKRIVHVNEQIKCTEKGYDLNIKQMKSMAKQGEIVSCGLITSNTKFLFRSKSACFVYLVQLSKEMWDFNKKQIHFETFIDGFLKTLINKWKHNDCNHAYSIIFFSRTYYDYDHVKSNRSSRLTKVFNKDSDDRYYRDHYMVVVRNWSTTNWNQLSQKLREAFDIFPRRVRWKRNINKISVAAEGNLLEAIQLALNVLDKHYIDRDLHRTALSITVVTAGSGHFFVDKALSTFTKVRILNNGINCDIVSMTNPPLHPTPLFIYGSPLAFEQNKWETLSYYQPTEMMQIKFFNYSPYNESPIAPPQQLYTKIANFLAIKNLSKTFAPLPLGDADPPSNNNIDFYNIYLQNECWNSVQQDCDQHDDQIFAPMIKSRSGFLPPLPLGHGSLSNSPLPSIGSLTPRYATINKRLHNAVVVDKLQTRLLGLGDTTDSSSEDAEEEGLNDDVGNEPNVGTLKKMFMASKQDGDDINDDPFPPDVQQFEESRSVIVIQHKDSYHQSGSIKNTLSALDPNNTPFHHPCADAESPIIQTIHHFIGSMGDFKLSEMECEEEEEEEELPVLEKEEEDVPLNYGDTHPFRTKWNDAVNVRNKRFGQVYPLPHQYCGFLFPSFDDQWKTLICPAILPLTNDTDFKQDVLECSKNVYKSNWQIGMTSPGLLNEMVLQRLTQDCQLMKTHHVQNENIRIAVLNTQTYIHQLTHIWGDPNVFITRYMDNRLADKESNILYKRDQTNFKAKEKGEVEEQTDIYQQVLSTFSVPYNYNLWNDHREIFQNYTVKLAEQHQLYNWTKLDKVCAEYCDDIENDLKARRIRFALIPNLNESDSDGTIIKNFVAWFTDITSTSSITKCGIEIIKRDRKYYDPSTWHTQGEYISDPLQIGFDSSVEIKKAKRLKIELESEWSDRNTYLILKYDTMYDPNVVFHFQLYWLIATGNAICKFVENIKKKANKLNLRLIPVPSAQPKKIADPFSKTMSVENTSMLSSKVMVRIHLELQTALINKFGFMLDTHYATNKAMTALQFMHRDGCAIVRWHSKSLSFTWVPNSNPCNQFRIRKQSIQLFAEFRKYFHQTIAKYALVSTAIQHIISRI
eukprot:144078_1